MTVSLRAPGIGCLLLLAWSSPRAITQTLPITRLSGGQTSILSRTSTSTTDSLSNSDCGKLIAYSNASAVAVTLPAATSLLTGCWIDVQNIGPGTVTLTPAGSTIDGAAAIALTPNQGVCVVDAGNQYLTQRGQGQGSKGGSTYSADNATLNLIGTTFSTNTAVMASRQTAAQGADTTCTMSSGSPTTYVGAMRGTAYTVGYADGMRVIAEIDTTTSGGAITLDCGSGAKAVYQNDGASNPTTLQWATGAQVLITYGGTLNSGAGGWRILSGGGLSTDNGYYRYYTTSVAAAVSAYVGAGFYTSKANCCQFELFAPGSQLWTLAVPYNSGDYVQWFGAVPAAGWTGAVKLKTFWTLGSGAGGTGSGSHAYQAACVTPGQTDQGAPYAFATPVDQGFNFSGAAYKTGQVDAVALNLPSCLAGDMLVIRMTRSLAGTAVDSSYVAYFDISLPRVVQ